MVSCHGNGKDILLIEFELLKIISFPPIVIYSEGHDMSKMKSFLETFENSSIGDSLYSAYTSVSKRVSEIVSNTSSTSIVMKKSPTL